MVNTEKTSNVPLMIFCECTNFLNGRKNLKFRFYSNKLKSIFIMLCFKKKTRRRRTMYEVYKVVIIAQLPFRYIKRTMKNTKIYTSENYSLKIHVFLNDPK